jgi:hypothetical protein
MALIMSILLPLRLAMLFLGLRQRDYGLEERMVAKIVWTAIALSFVIVSPSRRAKVAT